MSKLVLGIEFGSTNIKAILSDEKGKILADGFYLWENDLINGYFSYPMDKVLKGMQICYKNLLSNYGKKIQHLDAIGISAMMHGYLAFDKDYNQLAEFRTWRNTKTEQASKILTEKLKFHMPQRWSSVFYYQAVLNKEDNVKDVEHLFTLSSYIHYLLTGKDVIGIGDASGMFPIKHNDYDEKKLQTYNRLLKENGIDKDLKNLLPKVLLAGEDAGTLTEDGAKLLDPSGNLQPGCVLCPPEGDMQTGMVCTNSIVKKRASVSSGTSANMTIVLEKDLENYYDKIDVITTPIGNQVALIHSNNCTSEINKWVDLFAEVIQLSGGSVDKGDLFIKLFNKSKESDDNCGKLIGYNFQAGEPLADTSNGVPLLLRESDGKLNLANFMQVQIYSAIATISLGLNVLQNEDITIDSVIAHGGFYKTKEIGQIATSALLKAPVTVMESSAEGGPYGIALLALYMLEKDKKLESFLDEIFKTCKQTTKMASKKDIDKINRFMRKYNQYLNVEQKACEE